MNSPLKFSLPQEDPKKAPHTNFVLNCPVPIAEYPQVLLAHGGGGFLMHQLIERMFASTFRNSFLEARHDGALFNLKGSRLALTTDSYVVQPPFFPGGDIGSLAVYGTVNDLAMCGARPLYLSVGFILEEGLPMETLWRIVQSMKKAAEHASVQIVTGDTKVVDKGKGDGVFINTTGVGIIEHNLSIQPSSVEPGDVILINGDIGRHGMAIMAVREGLSFESPIESDSAPLAELVLKLLDEGIEVHCLRDLTRGGLASALNEIAATRKIGITIDEKKIPAQEEVRGACEVLGLDPLYVANEGRMIVFVPPKMAEHALALMRSHPLGGNAEIIGQAKDTSDRLVTMVTAIGTHRILDMLVGDQLPRIC